MKWVLLICLVVLVPFVAMLLLMAVDTKLKYRKVRKIHSQLYGDNKADYKDWLGDTINFCVLCPVCRGFVYVGCWDEHIRHGHKHVHHITPLEERFIKAAKRLQENSR